MSFWSQRRWCEVIKVCVVWSGVCRFSRFVFVSRVGQQLSQKGGWVKERGPETRGEQTERSKIYEISRNRKKRQDRVFVSTIGLKLEVHFAFAFFGVFTVKCCT
jgi:hypothetical protein